MLGAVSKSDEVLLNSNAGVMRNRSKNMPEFWSRKPVIDWGSFPKWSSSWSGHLHQRVPEFMNSDPDKTIYIIWPQWNWKNSLSWALGVFYCLSFMDWRTCFAHPSSSLIFEGRTPKWKTSLSLFIWSCRRVVDVLNVHVLDKTEKCNVVTSYTQSVSVACSLGSGLWSENLLSSLW